MANAMKHIRVLSVLLISLGAVAVFLFWSQQHSLKRNESALDAASSVAPTNFSVQGRRAVSWKEIETPDYKLYVANLRKIGCPEATVEDIVVADVNALFLERAKPILEELKQAVGRHYRSDKKNLLAASRSSLEPINAERLAVISKLLKHEVEKFKIAMAPWSYALDEIASNDYPYLSAEKSAKLAEFRRNAKERMQALYTPGQTLSGEQLRPLDELYRSQEREIAKLLTPEEFQEYLLRSSFAADELGRKLAKVTVSDDEYRAIFKATRDFQEKYGYYYVDPQALAQGAADQQNLSKQINATLGDSRYAEYLRENDPMFQWITSFSQQNSLTDQQSVDLYNLKKETEQQVRTAISTATDGEQGQQSVSGILDGAQQRLGQLLGDQTLGQYINSKAGMWFRVLRADPSRPPRYGGQTSGIIGVEK
jgi:hypothetical protein